MDFWDVHSIGFIIAALFFPRITMLCMGICFVPYAHPILFWLSFFLTPRLLIAILATTFYWQTNPVLCIFAWMNALCVGNASNHIAANQVNNRRR